jgi:hypothetical protein
MIENEKEVMNMSNVTKQLVSDMLDDEVTTQQVDALASSLEIDHELKNTYARYALVSDVLQNNTPEQIDLGFSHRVSLALEGEPTVLGGFHKRLHVPSIFKQVASLAAAASLTAVTILGIQSYSVTNIAKAPSPATTTIAAAPGTASSLHGDDWVRVSGVNWNKRPTLESKLNSYLVNHNAYTSGMQGLLPYAKIISYKRAEDQQPIATPRQVENTAQK